MKKSIYDAITNLFPVSPIDAVGGIPEDLKTGKILTYIARVDRLSINDICTHFTGEDPSKAKKNSEFDNWKNQVQYDTDGSKLHMTDESGEPTKELYRRWEPVQFVHNRKATPGHFKLLANRFSRTGYKPSLRKIVIGSDGNCLDGQHSLLALWYFFQETSEDYVDVSIEINSKDDPKALFRLFDQAQRKRTLKDALTTLGIEGFEADLAGTLRFVTLLASGRDLNQSRLTLAHITDEKGKAVNLQPDDIAGLLSSGECFEYVQEDLLPLLSQEIVLIDEESGDETSISLLAHPALTGPGMPNAQYWMTAYLNAKYDLRATEELTLDTFTQFLTLVANEDLDHESIAKLRSFKPTKAIEWLPAIEHCFHVWNTPDMQLKRSMPKTLTFNGIQAKYDSYTESMLETDSEEDSEETEDQYEDA